MADYSYSSLRQDADSQKGDDYFRSLGFSSGRQGAYDYLARERDAGRGDLNDSMNMQAAKQQEIIKPAIESYNASIPEIKNIYQGQRTRTEAQRQPLIDRYNNLISEIKGNQTSAVNNQTRATNNELAKRGLFSDTGVGQQELVNTINPIYGQYATVLKDTGINQEQDIQNLEGILAGLSDSETTNIRDVYNSIAGLKASSGQQGIQNAFLQNNSNQQAIDNAKTYDLALKTLQMNTNNSNISNELARIKQDNDTRTTNAALAKAAAAAKGGGDNIGDLIVKAQQSLGTGQTPLYSYDPKTGVVSNTKNLTTVSGLSNKAGF